MSSRKTKKHSLHIWEPHDSFLRAEFNENMEKIDTVLDENGREISATRQESRESVSAARKECETAVASARAEEKTDIANVRSEMRMVKLLDTTLGQDMERWTIDVSGIDFFRYAEVQMYVESGGSAFVILQTNGVTENKYTYCYPNMGSNNIDRLVELSYMDRYVLQISFVVPQRGRKVAVVVNDIESSSGSYHTRGCTSPVKWEDLRTLDLARLYDNTVVAAGTRVVLVGIKK